eukprot:CAMPEP_0168473566 /NCGR_PEP_ID=MMETSP0228-20121227/60390_1 /TAXON_ID=133427 /ORGANISM="Protoceratium reticulatum, Strain CCCM 535 (=CCMP 1889)" /LENGTH=97 /DNA_ID=CAMNT_0008489563 /DNA_START=2446 /DNA_END=2739 /DNA_ORIENTATION=-
MHVREAQYIPGLRPRGIHHADRIMHLSVEPPIPPLYIQRTNAHLGRVTQIVGSSPELLLSKPIVSAAMQRVSCMHQLWAVGVFACSRGPDGDASIHH